MRIPTIQGVIDRRILVNYRIAPDVMAANLPEPFKPVVHNGFAIGGICLIRLKKVRPKLLPIPIGIGSENAAHRIAVTWEVKGQTKEGVYIPRRDTDSLLNSFAGGTIFPGVHHHSEFKVLESGDDYSVEMNCKKTGNRVFVVGRSASEMPADSVFDSVDSVSRFFERGSLGYSDTKTAGTYDGLELDCKNWHVQPFDVEVAESSFFDDESRFPAGTIEFDCALLMKDIDHQWHSREDICCVAN